MSKIVNTTVLINNWSCCIYWTDGEREMLQKPTREKGNSGTRPQAMLEWMWVRICGINWLEVRVVRITWCSANQGPIEGSVYQSTHSEATQTSQPQRQWQQSSFTKYMTFRMHSGYSSTLDLKQNNDCGVKGLTFSFNSKLLTSTVYQVKSVWPYRTM